MHCTIHDDAGVCAQDPEALLLKETDLIIWDKAPMQKKLLLGGSQLEHATSADPRHDMNG